MGIRLVESIKLSHDGSEPRWEFSLRDAAVLFDGDGYAVCSDLPGQPDGPQFICADVEATTTEMHSGYNATADSFAHWAEALALGHYAPALQAEL